MVSGKLLETHTASPVSSELPNVRGAEFPQWWSIQPLSLRFRITKTSPNEVSNQIPFELGDASKYCKYQFSRWQHPCGDAPGHILCEYLPATALGVVPQLADLHRWVLTVVC